VVDRKRLLAGLWLACRLHVTLVPSWGLVDRDGKLGVDPARWRCHPLETVLIGEPVTSVPRETQVAVLLGAPEGWVQGFRDAYAGDPPREETQGYLAGYREVATLGGRLGSPGESA
jgi:hypothetical protein